MSRSFNEGSDEAGGTANDERQKEELLELGIPEEWIEPLFTLGLDSIEKLKKIEKPGKLHQEMMGIS